MMLKHPSVILFIFHQALFDLLDSGFMVILLTIDPDVKACGLDYAFTAYHYEVRVPRRASDTIFC